MTNQPQRAPVGLHAAGRRLWRAVADAFELRGDELVVLAAACHLTDEIATLEADLATVPRTLILGSKGQVRVNPLYAEVRAHRLAAAKLLQQLGLSESDEVSSGLARSAAGRRMAGIRWHGKGA